MQCEATATANGKEQPSNGQAKASKSLVKAQSKKEAKANGKIPAARTSKGKGKDADEIQPWQESMFYLHFLSLPMFWFIRDDLAAQVSALSASPPVLAVLPTALPAPLASLTNASSSFAPVLHPPLGLEQPLSLWALLPTPVANALVGLAQAALELPSGYVPLALTTATSMVCVAGVNRLTARVSSLTVTLVLVVRKAVSMVVSVVLFGARGGGEVDVGMMWAGAAGVFLGTVGYAVGARVGGAKGKAKGNGREKEKAKRD